MGRHHGVHGSLNQSVMLEFAKLLGQHLVRNAGELAAQLVVAP